MKLYLDYFMLKEYKRQGKYGEYQVLKKRIVDTLNQEKWTTLAGKMLEEDEDFTTEAMTKDSTGVSIEVQLDELTSSTEPKDIRQDKFK